MNFLGTNKMAKQAKMGGFFRSYFFPATFFVFNLLRFLGFFAFCPPCPFPAPKQTKSYKNFLKTWGKKSWGGPGGVELKKVGGFFIFLKVR